MPNSQAGPSGIVAVRQSRRHQVLSQSMRGRIRSDWEIGRGTAMVNGYSLYEAVDGCVARRLWTWPMGTAHGPGHAADPW